VAEPDAKVYARRTDGEAPGVRPGEQMGRLALVLLVFIAGAATLAVEMAASRLSRAPGIVRPLAEEIVGKICPAEGSGRS
jgi:hypothetical protein